MHSPLLIAQLTDPHLGTGPAFLGGRIDTERAFQRAVTHVAALQPRPDLVLLTGDMTEHGRPDEYARVAAALAPLDMPIYAVPGNHDDSHTACTALPAYMPVAQDAPAGRCCYHIQLKGLHCVALDTSVSGHAHGVLDTPQLAWLANTLQACSGLPVLLFMHHPPLPSGIEAMDACSLLVGSEQLAALIRQHARVQGILCGHLHRAVQMQFAGVPVHVAPSVAHQIALDLQPGASLHAQLEPPQISLHRWTPLYGLCTHLSYVEPYGPAIAF
ncbi:phosphodiesterase [Lampropedia aestuarii]|uniref:Phosphodiesterase n=1 Tax=Lampropedia aestuarii TaxID=2562762 RepID=A0A4S5C1T1_9BURK|nr:phosphodiesterase [Lampropedia aestuarii]THJ36396.1 phosphodiesterase [Lampropedia aestuarii]